MTNKENKSPNGFKFLSKKQSNLLVHAGSVILGVSPESLGDAYLNEIDDYVFTLPKWLQKEFKLLFWSFNSLFMGIFFIKRLKSFTSMSPKQQEKYVSKWAHSRIPLMRSGIIGLKGVCGWGYFSQNEAFLNEIQYPGSTIGREDKTPTLLFGKEPWKPSNI